VLSNVVLLLALTPSQLSLSQAAQAVAQGESVDEASSRLLRAGQQGLWLLHDRAKKEQGESRARLFELVGRFATAEAEWALLQELKKGPLEGRIGALRGLGHSKSTSSLLRQAGHVQADLRAVLAESLVAAGSVSEKQLRDLAASEHEGAREVALRYLTLLDPSPLARELGAAALRDPSPGVVNQALALAARVKDASQIYTLADIARSAPEATAELAVSAMAAIDDRSSSNELGSVIGFAASSDRAWRRAAEALRDRSRGLLARAVARAPDARRREIAHLASQGAEPSHYEPVIDLLDDPSLDVREAALVMLSYGGAAARSAGEARLATPLLPELAAGIQGFLAAPPSTPPEAVSVR
jgi:hypothetical protein